MENVCTSEDGDRFGAFLEGRRVEPRGAETALVNPATAAPWGVSVDSRDLVSDAVESAAAAAAKRNWADMDASERGRLFWRLADLIERDADRLARLEVLATGKILATTRREMARAAAWYRFFGGAVDKIGGEAIRLSPSVEARTVREPIGVVAAITPFNGPFSLGAWKIAPALAAGNAVVVKPPLDCPASTLVLAELMVEAGFPPGILNVVPGGAETGAALVGHGRVGAVAFTGSTPTARRIGAEAGGALKRFVCEAGGKSAHIVFDDAQLDHALIAARQGVFSNAGQTCVAGSRLLVQDAVFDAFVERFVASARKLRLGDPIDPSTHVGPLASRLQLDRVSGMVARAGAAGARIVGGGRPDLPSPFDQGFFFAPTIVLDSEAASEIWREEVFGPVVALRRFRDEDEAVALANDSDYGLAAGLWTRDMARADRMSRRLQAGTVWVNAYRVMSYRVPFGGYKQSGLGRENGMEAIREFQEVKAVVTDYAAPVDPFAP